MSGLSGTPYINHPIGVANLICDVGGVSCANTLVAALLHDTVEDTDTSFEELERVFGKTIRDIVGEVTDDKDLKKDERKRQQIIHAATSSTPAKLVKLADKLYNLRDLLENPPAYWSLSRIQGYFVWSEKVIESLAGTNEPMERALGEVFQSSFTYEGQTVPVIPTDVPKDVFLQQYYESIKDTTD
eukprot:TRINITY_DN2115_c0_g1_i1.p1 TRINITY_DN2115_c0_g1~~TRINITY_DN2115_c0_g1_i1.p1  ORF type:complete len:198 (-),score=54.95 TRINITY_DN2115_c0_g1_i1:105-662(-)